jgi:hypothetical protein
MPPTVLIAHATKEEDLAESLVQPLRKAGYEVSYEGTVLAGESLVRETERVLRQGAPVVLCGTERACGNQWVRRLVSTARQINNGMLFILQMEEEADVELFSFGEKIAGYWEDPDKALAGLISALHKYYPVEETNASFRLVGAAERQYRDILLHTCDIISLANLPEQDCYIAQKLKLRSLYIKLRVFVEASAGDDSVASGQDDKLWKAPEERRASARKGQGADETRERQRVPVGERLGEAKRLVVLGDPGSGKTTLTRWIATAYLLRLKEDGDWADLPDVRTLPDADWLPVIIRCRDLDLNTLTRSLEDILRHTLRRAEVNESEAAGLPAIFHQRLSAGTALLMIDGLDEIADPAVRARFCQQLEEIVVAYPNAPVLATSRIVGYREMGYKLGRGFEHLTLADLSRDEKDDFARRWCLFTEVPERRETAAGELIRDIHSSDRIERLTGSPLLLTTMAVVKRKVGKLPSRRAELYWEAVQVLLNWRSELDKPLDSREALPQLEYAAYDMSNRGVQQARESELLDLFSRMREEYPSIRDALNRPPREFLKRLEARTGILVQAGFEHHLKKVEPIYKFRDLIFQEYLTAKALAEGCFPGYYSKESLAAHVAKLAGLTGEIKFSERSLPEVEVVETWCEVLRLCATICSTKDVHPVLLAILTPQENETPQIYRARAILALSCLADEPNISTAVAEQIIQVATRQAGERDAGDTGKTGLSAAGMELTLPLGTPRLGKI